MARIVFMGSKSLGHAVATRLLSSIRTPDEVVGIVTLTDQGDPRSALPQFESLAASSNVPMVIVHSSRDADVALERFAPQIVIVVGWYFLINISRFPTTRFFGFHASPLPRYRGNAPVVWQLLRGESQVGLSLFQFGDGMDDGPIVSQSLIDVSVDDGIGDVLSVVETRTIEMLDASLPNLLLPRPQMREQDHSLATYCGLRTAEDGLIDWTCRAEEVHNFIRSQSKPYPGAFTYLPDGSRLTIWKSTLDPRPYLGVAGAVAERSSDFVLITCGTNAIRILEAEIDDQQSDLSPAQLITSLRVRLGRNISR